VSSGLPVLFVPLETRRAVDGVRFELAGMRPVFARHQLDDLPVFVFSLETGHDDATAYSRMFAPAFGIPEDPATGGASGPLGAYLVHYGVVSSEDNAQMVSLQGVKMGRPSRVHISISTSPENGDITSVQMEGHRCSWQRGSCISSGVTGLRPGSRRQGKSRAVEAERIIGGMTSKASDRRVIAAAGLVVLASAPASAQTGSSFLDASRSAIDYTVATTRPVVACESLRSLTDHDYTVISATRVDATPDVPEHCRGFGVIPPEIRFNVNLPTEWNGRFYMHGDGGYAGTPPIDLPPGLYHFL